MVQRTIFESATADAALLRYSAHVAYRSAAQKSAVRALLTMPDEAGLMVSMRDRFWKNLRFSSRRSSGAAGFREFVRAAITPTVALAHDHERTLSQISGLEGSRALTGDVVGEARVDLLSAFRRGEVPILFLSPELASTPLPSEPEALRALAVSLHEALAVTERELAARDAELHAKTLHIEKLLPDGGGPYVPP